MLGIGLPCENISNNWKKETVNRLRDNVDLSMVALNDAEKLFTLNPTHLKRLTQIMDLPNSRNT
jgi:hypothetical protein